MPIEVIDIPEQKADSRAKCNCGNREWIRNGLEINAICAGPFALCWKLSFLLQCSNCQTILHDQIGIFDNNLHIIKDWPARNLDYFNSLSMTSEIKNKMKKIKEGWNKC